VEKKKCIKLGYCYNLHKLKG